MINLNKNEINLIGGGYYSDNNCNCNCSCNYTDLKEYCDHIQQGQGIIAVNSIVGGVFGSIAGAKMYRSAQINHPYIHEYLFFPIAIAGALIGTAIACVSSGIYMVTCR